MKLVLVVWEDAATVDGPPWVSNEDAKVFPPAVLVQQVGYVVKYTNEAIFLTSAFGEGFIAKRDRIPAGMVRSVTELAPTGKPMAIKRPAKQRPEPPKD